MSDSRHSSAKSGSVFNIGDLPSVRTVSLQSPHLPIDPRNISSSPSSQALKPDDSRSSHPSREMESPLFLSLRETPTISEKSKPKFNLNESQRAIQDRIRRTNRNGYLKLGDLVLIGVKETYQDHAVYKGFLSSDGITNQCVNIIPRDSEIERGANSILRSCLFQVENARSVSKDTKDSVSDKAYNVGKLLTFGESIMFRHIHSRGFLSLNEKGVASENGCLQLQIATRNVDERAWFTIEHIDITKQPGDPIKYSDSIFIKTIYRGSSYFIHFLQKIRSPDDKLECNLYGTPNKIHIRCYMSYQDLSEDLTVLNTNNAFRIFHKISNSYLTLSQSSIMNAKTSPDLYLEVKQKSNANNLWELQKEATFTGGIAESEVYYRIMHVVTGYYLKESTKRNGSYRLTITSNPQSEGTLFKFYVDPDTPSNQLAFKLIYKIESETGNYLEIEELKESYMDLVSNSKATKPKLLKLQRSSKAESGFIFCIKDAHAKKVNHIYQICNAIPNFLDFSDYLTYISMECYEFNSDPRITRQIVEECQVFMSLLDNFLNFIIIRGQSEASLEKIQSSIRETGVLEALMEISMLINSLVFKPTFSPKSSTGSAWKKHDKVNEEVPEATRILTDIKDKIYTLIYQIIRGNVKNNAAIAQHRDYLFHQLKFHTKSVGKLIRELYNYYALQQTTVSRDMISTLWNDLEPISEYNSNINSQINCIQIISTLCEFEEQAVGTYQSYIIDELNNPVRDFFILRFDLINNKPTIEFQLPRIVPFQEFLDRNPTLDKLQIARVDELLILDEKAVYYVEDLMEHSEIIEYIDTVIELYCEICRERQQKGIKLVREKLNADVHNLLSVINNVSFNSRLRGRYAKLLRVAYVDIEPYLRLGSNPLSVYTWGTQGISDVTFPNISPSYNYDILQFIYSFWDTRGLILIQDNKKLVEDITLTTRVLKLTHDILDFNIDTDNIINIIMEPLCIIIMNKEEISKHWCRDLMITLNKNKQTQDGHLFSTVESYMMDSALSILQIILNLRKKNLIKNLLDLFKSNYDTGNSNFDENQGLSTSIIDIVNRLDFTIEYSSNNRVIKLAYNIAKLQPQDTEDSTHKLDEVVKHSYELDIYLLELLFDYEKNKDKLLKKRSLNLLIQNLNLRKILKLDLKDVEFLSEPLSINTFLRMVDLKRDLHAKVKIITQFQNENDILSENIAEEIKDACDIIFEVSAMLEFEMKDRYKVSKYQNLARHAGLHEDLIAILYLSADNKIYSRLFQFAIDAIYLFCFRKYKNQSLLAQHKDRLIELIGTCLGVTRILSLALSKFIKNQTDLFVNNVIKMIIDNIQLHNLKFELLQVLRTLLLDENLKVVPKFQINILKGLLNNKAIITLNSEEMKSSINFLKPILNIADIPIPDNNPQITEHLQSLKSDHLHIFHIELMKTINACAYQNRFSILQCRKLISRRNLFKRIMDTKIPYTQKKVYLRFMYQVFMVEIDNIPPVIKINDLDEIIDKVIEDIQLAGYGLNYIIDIAKNNLYENIRPIDSYKLTEESEHEMIRQKSNLSLGPMLVEGNAVVISHELQEEEQNILDTFNYLSGDKSWHTEKDGLLHVLKDLFTHNRYIICEETQKHVENLLSNLDTFSREVQEAEDQNTDLDFSNLSLVLNSCRETIPVILQATIDNAESKLDPDKYQAITKVLKLLREFIVREKLQLEESFKQFDINRDGTISLEEFTKSIKTVLGHDILLTEIEDAYNELDEDNDNLIIFKEFKNLLRKYFIKDQTVFRSTKTSALKFAGSEYIDNYKSDELDEDEDIFRSMKLFNNTVDINCQETDINILVEKVRKNIVEKYLETHNSSKLSSFITNLEKVFKKKDNKVYVLKILNLIIPQDIQQAEFHSMIHEIQSEQLNSIQQIQNLYIDSGVHLTAIDIIYEDSDKSIIYEAFELLEALVRYGNIYAQSSMLSELKKMTNTYLFSYIRNQIRLCRDRIVERVNKSYSTSQNTITTRFYDSGDNFFDSKCFILSAKEKKKIEHVKTLLNFIIGCCENCNSDFQNYFREQTDDLKKNKLSINLVEELGMFLINIKEVGRLLRNDDEALKIIPRCLIALVNLCRGPCKMNQLNLGVKRKLYQFVKQYMELSKDDLDIRYCIIFLESLLEGETQRSVAEIMAEEIDFLYLSEVAADIYHRYIHINIRSILQDRVIGSTTDSILLIFLNLLSTGRKFEDTGLSIEVSSWIEIGFEIVIIIIKLRNLFPSGEGFKYLRFSDNWGDKRDSNFEVVKKISKLGGRQEKLLPGLISFLKNTYETVRNHINKTTVKSTLDEVLEFYLSLICTVEIDRNGLLEKHYFRAPGILTYQSDRMKWDLIAELNRNSHEEKIKSFYYLSEKRQLYLEHLQFLSRFTILSWWAEKWDNLADLNYILVIVANIIILLSMEDHNDTNLKINGTDMNGVLIAIGLMIVILSIVIYLFYILENYKVIIYDKVTRGNKARNISWEMLKGLRGTMLLKHYQEILESNKSLKHVSMYLKLPYIILDSYNIYNLLYVIISLFALNQPYLYCLLLLDILRRNENLRDILKAITLNWKALVLTGILAIIIIFGFGIIAFLYLGEYYALQDEGAQLNNYCFTLWQCFTSTFTNGIRAGGGIGEFLLNPVRDENDYWLRITFDLIFFMMIIIVLLNIIFGIIIDNFASLRDMRKEFLQDYETVCMICGREKHEFESRGSEWSEHISIEHNMWSYIGFIFYIRKKPSHRCNGLEKYVKMKISQQDVSFFPKTSQSLEMFEEGEEDSDTKQLEQTVQSVSQAVVQLQKRIQDKNKLKQTNDFKD